MRLETELWDWVDRRLREDHDLPLSWFEPMQVMDRVVDCRVVDIAEELLITVGGEAGRRVLNADKGSGGDELAAWLGAAVSPERIASLASIVRDVRRHVAGQQGVAR